MRLRSLRGERRFGREGVRLRVRVRCGGVGDRCRAGGEGVTLTLKRQFTLIDPITDLGNNFLNFLLDLLFFFAIYEYTHVSPTMF